MAYPKGKPRPEKSGRKKGTPNKFTSIKEAFLEVFCERGADGLREWAAKDAAGFYRTVATFVPKELRATIEGELSIVDRIMEGRKRARIE